jgi:hypothetical protein
MTKVVVRLGCPHQLDLVAIDRTARSIGGGEERGGGGKEAMTAVDATWR